MVEPRGFSLDDARVKRAGLDYWPRVKPLIWPDWKLLEKKLPEFGEPFFFSSEGTRDYWDVRFPPRTLLVFGRESDGLPLGIRQSHNDHMLRLPMVDPQLRSLNLANTVAVVLYEVLRQRHRALNSNR